MLNIQLRSEGCACLSTPLSLLIHSAFPAYPLCLRHPFRFSCLSAALFLIRLPCSFAPLSWLIRPTFPAYLLHSTFPAYPLYFPLLRPAFPPYPPSCPCLSVPLDILLPFPLIHTAFPTYPSRFPCFPAHHAHLTIPGGTRQSGAHSLMQSPAFYTQFNTVKCTLCTFDSTWR